jgi:hypothetical protein
MARLDTLTSDLRFALRHWCRRPLFASIAVVTLALGVGAPTAMSRSCSPFCSGPFRTTSPSASSRFAWKETDLASQTLAGLLYECRR